MWGGNWIYAPKRYIGIKECAEYLDIKEKTLYGWVFRRKIPHVKMNKLVKFDLLEIDKWVDKDRVKEYKMKEIER